VSQPTNHLVERVILSGQPLRLPFRHLSRSLQFLTLAGDFFPPLPIVVINYIPIPFSSSVVEWSRAMW